MNKFNSNLMRDNVLMRQLSSYSNLTNNNNNSSIITIIAIKMHVEYRQKYYI